MRAVALALLVLAVTAAAQTAVFVASGSVALLADLIHKRRDRRCLPVALRARRASRGTAGGCRDFVSACVAGVEAVVRLVDPNEPDALGALAAAGALGCAGNFVAARIRTRAGRRLASPALVADGDHARADAYVSLAVVASAIAVALGADVLDPIIGLAITAVILRITWRSWRTVSGG